MESLSTFDTLDATLSQTTMHDQVVQTDAADIVHIIAISETPQQLWAMSQSAGSERPCLITNLFLQVLHGKRIGYLHKRTRLGHHDGISRSHKSKPSPAIANKQDSTSTRHDKSDDTNHHSLFNPTLRKSTSRPNHQQWPSPAHRKPSCNQTRGAQA